MAKLVVETTLLLRWLRLLLLVAEYTGCGGIDSFKHCVFISGIYTEKKVNKMDMDETFKVYLFEYDCHRVVVAQSLYFVEECHSLKKT